MVLRADRLNTQSGAAGGASKAALGRHICASEPTSVETPGSELETSSLEWGTHPASATAKTTDSWRGTRSQVIPE